VLDSLLSWFVNDGDDDDFRLVKDNVFCFFGVSPFQTEKRSSSFRLSIKSYNFILGII
jgi:hypothetical protein